jgi:hypothetical protein
MYTDERIKKVNKVIKDIIFDYEGRVASELYVNLQYQFKITGVKPMISVGELYDYLTVDVVIVGGDKIFTAYMKLIPNFIDSYYLVNDLSSSISDELQYFFGSERIRIHLNKDSINLSDEYQEIINNFDIKSF